MRIQQITTETEKCLVPFYLLFFPFLNPLSSQDLKLNQNNFLTYVISIQD